MALAASGITRTLDFSLKMICWFSGGETWNVYNFMKLFVMGTIAAVSACPEMTPK